MGAPRTFHSMAAPSVKLTCRVGQGQPDSAAAGQNGGLALKKSAKVAVTTAQ